MRTMACAKPKTNVLDEKSLLFFTKSVAGPGSSNKSNKAILCLEKSKHPLAPEAQTDF